MSAITDPIDPMRPFSLGFKMGILGRDPRECPYDSMTKEWYEWVRGHNIGVQLGNSEVVFGGE